MSIFFLLSKEIYTYDKVYNKKKKCLEYHSQTNGALLFVNNKICEVRIFCHWFLLTNIMSVDKHYMHEKKFEVYREEIPCFLMFILHRNHLYSSLATTSKPSTISFYNRQNIWTWLLSASFVFSHYEKPKITRNRLKFRTWLLFVIIIGPKTLTPFSLTVFFAKIVGAVKKRE